MSLESPASNREPRTYLRQPCAVCGRTKGPGELTRTPREDDPAISIPIHGGHRINTIFRAGITLKLVPIAEHKGKGA